ncbi:MAG: cobaltochelatase, CobN subunit, partial [Pseudomonadota bacterium]
MHLLLAQKGTIAEGDEAIDLGQSPADILFLSAADTELAAMAAANTDVKADLRIASLMTLRHPMSVDTYVERTARHARLIVIRALGGASYFHYVLEAFQACAMEHGIALICLPGDDKPDPALDAFSTVSSDHRLALWAYMNEGGAENTTNFLRYAQSMIDGSGHPDPAKPLLKAGIWWPGKGVIGVETWRDLSLTEDAALSDTSPLVAISFYRALVQSGETKPVEALIAALQARGMRVLPLFVSSLKDAVSVGTLSVLFADHPPDVVVNATAFAVSQPGAVHQPTVLDATGAVVLQAIFSSSSRETWANSTQGLSSRDLAMHVSLPEVDGRVLARAVSFKSSSLYDARVEANIVSHEPAPDRINFVAELAANWARLRRTPMAERKVAIILANYPNRDGRLGNGVGLDTPQGTVEVLKAMKSVGYLVADVPEDGDALMHHLMAGPTNAGNDGRIIRETLSVSQYKQFFASLPKMIQEDVMARWGAPEQDPYIVGDVFALSLASFGAVMIGIQPARGYNIDPKDTYHSPDLVPPHGYFAFYAYLRETFGAHAIVHMGKHGNMEWLPGKALALSETCYPEATFGPVPHLYPFIVNDPGEGTQAKRRSSAVIIDHLTPPLTRAESYGPLKSLEALVDEYYEASGGDPRRVVYLKKQILDLVHDLGLDHDAGIAKSDDDGAALQKLDAWLCDLKEMQIRDGLHIFGRAPQGRLLTDLTVALARVPRGLGQGADQSLQRAIARDVFSTCLISPLEGEMSAEPTEGGEQV